MTKEQKFERAYLIAVAQGQLFWLEDADFPHHNPAFYIGNGLDPNVYIARPYADAPTRMKAFIAFARNITRAADQIRVHLQTRSEERRAGKECVNTCISRWAPYY